MSDIENESEIFPRKRKNSVKENYIKRMRGESYMGHKLVDNQITKIEKPSRKVGKFALFLIEN